ncbi:MAG: hypothetical protein LBJ67_19085 [Planctomycetaceae bacterium]|jgi:hypothetical protein|nr:hypothetical protein [Planctomycetaceae bacterium]
MKKLFLYLSYQLIFSSFMICQANELPDGVDLYIEAVRNRGVNHTLLRSISYEADQINRLPILSEDEIEEIATKREALVREAMKNNPKGHLWIKGIREATRKHYMQKEVCSRLVVKYKATSSLKKLFSLQVGQKVSDTSKWAPETIIIEDNTIGKKGNVSTGVVWFPQNRSARVGEPLAYMEPLINFGRLRGQVVPYVEAMLFQDTNIEKYEFSKTNIEKFKSERQKQIKSGKTNPLQTIGIVSYDNNSEAFVVESSVGKIVMERYWIDASRGYICPLVQYYDENGKRLSEYKASKYFLHEKSGLWFPSVYTEITLDKMKKEQHKEYHIDFSLLDVNFQVTDDDFFVQLPESVEVIDTRSKGKTLKYKTLNTGIFSLGKNGLNLEKKDWLHLEGLPSPKRSKYFYLRMFLICVGLLIIIWSVCVKLRKHCYKNNIL